MNDLPPVRQRTPVRLYTTATVVSIINRLARDASHKPLRALALLPY